MSNELIALPAELKASMVERNQRYLDKLDIEQLDVFITEQQKTFEAATRALQTIGASCAINIGRALIAAKRCMRHGEFRAWAERQHGYKPSTVTHYMKCARHAAVLKHQKNIDFRGLSVRGLLALIPPAQPRQQLKDQRNLTDGAKPNSNRRAGSINLVGMELDYWVREAPEQVAELLLDDLERLVKILRRVRSTAANDDEE